MDNIAFTRLINYIKDSLGNPEAITLDNLSHITVLVCEYIDTINMKSADPILSTEKHQLALDWIDRILKEFCDGTKLSKDVAKLNSDYIARLCEVSKGMSTLNNIKARLGSAVKLTQETEQGDSKNKKKVFSFSHKK